MSNQYGIKEVLNLQLLDLATLAPLAYIDYAEMSEIDNTSARLDISGGQGNYRLLSFDHTKQSTMKLKLPLVDTKILSLLMGDTVSTAVQNIYYREILTITAGAATFSNTPLSGTTPTVYFLNGSRDNGTALTPVATTPAAGAFSFTGAAATFNVADNGKQVVAWYQYATPSTTTKFSMKANRFIGAMKVIGTGIARDQVTGTDKVAVFTIHNARFKPTFNFALSSTTATSLDLELDMYSVIIGADQVYYDVVFIT